jgi:lantibiotic biosynthesis protein
MQQSGDERRAQDLRSLFSHSGFFVLRTALLPFAELVGWNEGRPGEPPQERGSYDERRNELRNRLVSVFKRSELREAIFFASRQLEERLDSWIETGEGLIEQALTRYYARLCSRGTPFGIFAGVSIGRITAISQLEISARDTYRRHTRPSMGYLGSLLSRAVARADPADGIRYEVNPSSYRISGHFRFSRTGPDGLSNPVVDVEPTPHLDVVLESAANGATLAEIAGALTSLGTEQSAGLDYARALVDHQVLIPCCLPSVTGTEPFEPACRALASHTSLRPLAELLGGVCHKLCELDGGPLGRELASLRGVALTLEQAGESMGLNSSSTLQADLIKPAPQLSLGEPFIKRLLNAAWLIQRTGLNVRNPSLDEFRERFTARYGSRWVSLVEALDGDLGLGFGQHQWSSTDAVLHGLGLGVGYTHELDTSNVDELRLEILTQALLTGALEYAIDPATLARFPWRASEPLPESFAIVAQIARSADRMTIVEPCLSAPSGVASMARFCHADPALEEAVRAHVELEQARAGHRLLVDVAYLPEGSVGNILLRPALRDTEIAYAGKSGAAKPRQLCISDLQVNVLGDSVRLYSRSLSRPVSIRITNALDHDAWRNLPIYRFLGAVQDDDRRSLPTAWSWGALESSPFLPRIVCEDVVLSRARWMLGAPDIAPLSTMTAMRALEHIRTLRTRLRLPRWVMLSKGDTPLVIDLENIISVEVFVREARGAPRISLHEVLPTPDELAVSGPEGRFAGEVFVPFVVRREEPIAAGGTRHFPLDTTAVRSFGPGTEWLYAKLYAGPSTLDSLVKHVAFELLPGLPKGAVELWFFLPYADPEPHLRLRFRGNPAHLLKHVVPALDGLRRKTRAVYRLQLDTYEREVERYGGEDGLELAEQAFHWDSEATASLLKLCEGDSALRWKLALLGVDRLLTDFVVDVEQRAILATQAMVDYRSELALTSRSIKAIGSRYRLASKDLGELLGSSLPDTQPEDRFTDARSICWNRSERLAMVVERLALLERAGHLSVGREEFVRALVHMHVIRMLGTRARTHELVIYDFLRRQYESRIARRSRAIMSQTV